MQRGGGDLSPLLDDSLTEFIFHGDVGADNPMQINAFDLCEQCATDIPAAERRYAWNVAAAQAPPTSKFNGRVERGSGSTVQINGT